MSEATDTAPTVVHRAAQPAATVTRTVTIQTVNEVADAIAPLLDHLAARGLAPSGPPFLRYLVVDMGAELVVQAGVPVAGPVAADEHVQPDELPAGDYLSSVHRGPYEGLLEATAALLAHAEREGLTFDRHPSGSGEAWAGRLEWYETNPVEEPDPSAWTTRIELKLAG